jgi:hypothetical protein
MHESNTHGNSGMLDGGIQYLKSRHRHQATLAAAASIPTPLKSIVVNPLSFPCHLAVGISKKEISKKRENSSKVTVQNWDIFQN